MTDTDVALYEAPVEFDAPAEEQQAVSFANPDAVRNATRQMTAEWGAGPVNQLKGEWGSDFAANLAFFVAFAKANPDIDDILTAEGFSLHPAVVRVGAILGRSQ